MLRNEHRITERIRFFFWEAYLATCGSIYFLFLLLLKLFLKLHKFQCTSTKLLRWKLFNIWIRRWLWLRKTIEIACWGLYFFHLFVAFVHPLFVFWSILWLWFTLLFEQILPVCDTLPYWLGQPVLAISVLAILGLELVHPCGLHRILIFWLLWYRVRLRFGLDIRCSLFGLGSIKFLKISLGPRPSFSFLDNISDGVLFVGMCFKIDLLLLCPHILQLHEGTHSDIEIKTI